jgi:hypothetical protein
LTDPPTSHFAAQGGLRGWFVRDIVVKVAAEAAIR